MPLNEQAKRRFVYTDIVEQYKAYIAKSKRRGEANNIDFLIEKIKENYMTFESSKNINKELKSLFKTLQGFGVLVDMKDNVVYFDWTEEEQEEVISAIYMARDEIGRFSKYDLDIMKDEYFGKETKKEIYQLLTSPAHLCKDEPIETFLSKRLIRWNDKKSLYTFSDAELEILAKWAKVA